MYEKGGEGLTASMRAAFGDDAHELAQLAFRQPCLSFLLFASIPTTTQYTERCGLLPIYLLLLGGALGIVHGNASCQPASPLSSSKNFRDNDRCSFALHHHYTHTHRASLLALIRTSSMSSTVTGREGGWFCCGGKGHNSTSKATNLSPLSCFSLLPLHTHTHTPHTRKTEGGTSGGSGDDSSTGAGSRKRNREGGEGEEQQPPSKMAAAEESEGDGPTNGNPSSNSTTTTTATAGGEDAAAGGGEPDRNRELIDRITEVETEKQQIEQGTHPEWQKKVDALQKVRDRRVFAAERFKQMQVENIQGLYEYEVLEAEGSYKAAMDELKTRLLDTMEQRVKRLEEDRERVLKQLERVGQTRVLRSKNVFRAEGDHPELNGGGGRGGGEGGGEGGAGGNVSMFLSDGEIKDDLRSISTDLAERARAYYDAQSDSMVEVSVEDNCLHYNEHCLLKGESIIFTSMLSGEDFVGRIASIRPHEILVKLSDGTKARIHMSYLRNGRIKLKCEGDATEV